MNERYPLVSVLVPSFNHRNFIEECIESVYNCGYPNLQVVVIDDNSSDGSKELLKKLKEKFDFELIIKEHNKGLVDSCNLGLSTYVKGKYYKLVASDDILIKDSVIKCVNILEKDSSIDVIIGKAIGLNNKSERIREYIPRIKGDLTYKNFLAGRITYNITAVLYKTSIHDKIGYYKEGVISEDIYFSRNIWKNCKIKFVDFFISGYRTHETNTSRDTWLMYEEGLKSLEELKSDKYFETKKQREYLNFFVTLSKEYKKEAMKYFISSLRFFYDRLFVIGVVNLLNLDKLFKK